MEKQTSGFSLVEILVAVAVISILVLTAFNFYNQGYVKVKIGGIMTSFEPLKLALTEFRVLQGDLRKLNMDNPSDVWRKLQLPNPAQLTPNISKVSVRSEGINKIDVLFCINETIVNIPKASKLGILYAGSYINGTLTWQCNYVASTNDDEALKVLLPNNCRQRVNSTSLTCK
jgi:prepilin-type N-terminal cleavage/methylation domain-containing protein